MMKTRLWIAPMSKRKSTLFYIDMFKSIYYYVLWTVSICTTLLHSHFVMLFGGMNIQR